MDSVGSIVRRADTRSVWQNVNDLPTTSTQQSGIALIFLMTSLAFVCCLCRVWVRISMKTLGLDDWLIFAAMALSLALSGPTYMFFKYEYIGFATVDVPDTYNPEPMLFWNWIMQVLYNPILALVKSSILVFLLRLGGHRRAIRYSIYGLNAFNILQMIAIFLVVICQTIPIKAYWTLETPRQHQIDSPIFYIITAIITIITDFLVLAIPIWIFTGLNMRTAAKIGLILVFLMGGVVSIVGIIRVHELRKKFYNIDPGYDSRDGLGDTYSTIEVNLAIIAACGPTLRPLFRKLMPGFFSNKSSNPNYKGPSGYGRSTGNRRTEGSYPLKEMGKTHTEIRGHSPDGSEEEIMSFHGIIRTTAVDVKYDEATISDHDARVESMDPANPRDNTTATPPR